MTDIYPYNTSSVRAQSRGMHEATVDALLTQHFGMDTVTISSARAGLYLILKSLGLWRTDHILVPDFLCRSVLYIINLQGFGVQTPDKRTTAAFILHQWGYPQRMDLIMDEAKKRNWIIIEDCAHTFGSTYRGQMVGNFGDAAIVSFPKFFPTYIGGAVVSKRNDIINYVKDARLKPRSFGHRIFDRISLNVARRNYFLRKLPFIAHAVYIKSIHFPKIPSSALRRFPPTKEMLNAELERRKYHFQTIKKYAGTDYHPKELDAESDVVPLCVPIFFPEEKLKAAQQALKEKNITADILHFDVNRNMLDPHYQKCLALPCHQYVTEKELGDICDVIRQV